jgi:hypothetical protein
MCNMIYISSRGRIGTLRKRAKRLYRPSIIFFFLSPNMLHYNPSRLSLDRAPSVIVVCCDVSLIVYCIHCSVLCSAGTQFWCLCFNPLNAGLNPICHLLPLLGGATIVVVSRLRVNEGRFVPSNCTSCFCTHSVVNQSSNLHCILHVGPGNR